MKKTRLCGKNFRISILLLRTMADVEVFRVTKSIVQENTAAVETSQWDPNGSIVQLFTQFSNKLYFII